MVAFEQSQNIIRRCGLTHKIPADFSDIVDKIAAAKIEEMCLRSTDASLVGATDQQNK